MALALSEVEFEGLLTVGQGMMYSLMVRWGEGGIRHSPPMPPVILDLNLGVVLNKEP